MAPISSGPSGVALGLSNTSDTGPLDGFTSDTTPTLGFFYVDNSTNASVQIFRDGVLVANTQTDANGFGFYDSPSLSDGTYVFTAVDPSSSTPGNIAPAIVTIDTVAPQLTYAAFNGSQIILTFDGRLDESALFDTTPFEVTFGNQSVYNEITISGNEVIIGLQSPPSSGSISVQYVDPSSGDDAVAVQDLAGNDFPSISGISVIDVTSDTTPPVLLSSTVVGDTLTLVYDSFLRQGVRPDVSSFTVTADGEPILLRTVQVAGGSVVLQLARPVVEGEQVEFSYSPSGVETQDQAGNAAASVSPTIVTNNTDNTAPSVAISIVDATLNLGDTASAVTFTFSEAPTDFTAADVTAFGGTLTGLAVDASNPLVYTATFTAEPNFNGTGSVAVTANSYTDAAGNVGSAGSDTVSINTLVSAGGNPPITPPTPTDGPDTLVGTNGSDTIGGGLGNDVIVGGLGSDDLNGNQGDDSLNGNQGNDLVHGGRGNDIVRGGQDDDQVYGDRGNDQVFGDNGNDFVNGNQGNDTVNGGMGNDIVHGGQDNDEVRGGQGNDQVFGDLGDDQVWGDLGNDTLLGGAGADTFHFAANSGNDIILDYSRTDGDKLDFGGQTFTVADVNGSAVFTLSGGGTVVLTGMSSTTMDASDFV